jgi:hypothetical protein
MFWYENGYVMTSDKRKRETQRECYWKDERKEPAGTDRTGHVQGMYRACTGHVQGRDRAGTGQGQGRDRAGTGQGQGRDRAGTVRTGKDERKEPGNKCGIGTNSYGLR